jgi:hypothetical protein
MFGIDDAVAAVSNLAGDVVKRVWPDATEIEKAKLAQVAQEMQNEFNLVLGQIEVNKVEAASSSLFVSGARPAILWICGVAFGYASIVEPLARFIAVVAFGYAGAFPLIDTDITLQILLGLLGLSGMRTFEKKHGVSR